MLQKFCLVPQIFVSKIWGTEKEKLIDSLSKGVVPWRKPWNDVIPFYYDGI